MSVGAGMSLFFLSLLMVHPSAVATSRLCRKQASQALPDSLTVEWLDLQPYMYMNSTAPSGVQGVFYELLVHLNKSLPVNINIGRHYKIDDLDKFKNASRSSSSGLILLPVTNRKSENADPCVIANVYYTKGSAYIVKRNVKKPLTQLGNSFINGGQIIAMTLILSIISGVLVWILDRRKNPENFPPSFIAGSWQGFWWAFVTMTTVGYGDTAPKSIPARLYSIVWMLLGMVAFSVLTANITSSLTYEIESDLNLYGKVVAVLSGSKEKGAAVAYGAGFIEYPNVTAMAAALNKGDVSAILLEIHTTSGTKEIDFKDHGVEIGKTVDYGYYFGMHLHHVFPNACIAIGECVQELVDGEEFQSATLKLLSTQVQLHERTKPSSSLFEDPSFFIILIALFSVLVGGGLLWEYFYYKPKMLRLAQVCAKEDIEMEGRKTGVDKTILLSSEVDELCDSCKERVNTITTNEGIQRIEALQASNFNPLDGFSIIGNQINSIPGVSSIRKFGSGLPTSVSNLPSAMKRKGKDSKQSSE